MKDDITIHVNALGWAAQEAWDKGDEKEAKRLLKEADSAALVEDDDEGEAT